MKYQNECLCCYRRILSTFFIPFSSEGRKCDFFARHNGRKGTAITTKALILTFQSANIDSNVNFMAFYALKYQNKCLCCYRSPLSTFSYHFLPRRESATFLLATLVSRPFSMVYSILGYEPLKSQSKNPHFSLCIPNKDFGKSYKR